MACGIKWQQLRGVEGAISSLTRLGIPFDNPAMRLLSGERARILGTIGAIKPRGVLQLARMLALSPGQITAFFDTEVGWLAEAIERPGAAAVITRISAEEAAAIIKGEITHEIEERLMTPDPYLGE